MLYLMDTYKGKLKKMIIAIKKPNVSYYVDNKSNALRFLIGSITF